MGIRMQFEGNAEMKLEREVMTGVNNLDLKKLSINSSSRRRIRFHSFEDNLPLGNLLTNQFLDTCPVHCTRENDSGIGSTSGGRIQIHLQKTTAIDDRVKRRKFARRNSKVGMMFFVQCKQEEEPTE